MFLDVLILQNDEWMSIKVWGSMNYDQLFSDKLVIIIYLKNIYKNILSFSATKTKPKSKVLFKPFHFPKFIKNSFSFLFQSKTLNISRIIQNSIILVAQIRPSNSHPKSYKPNISQIQSMFNLLYANVNHQKTTIFRRMKFSKIKQQFLEVLKFSEQYLGFPLVNLGFKSLALLLNYFVNYRTLFHCQFQEVVGNYQ